MLAQFPIRAGDVLADRGYDRQRRREVKTALANETGRVCVLRMLELPARKGNQVQPATLRFAEYVIVFTTFPEPPFSAADVLGSDRRVDACAPNWCSSASSWGVRDDSAKAWHGKRPAISPWGYDVPAPAPPEPVA